MGVPPRLLSVAEGLTILSGILAGPIALSAAR
jgi:hypothetical protein